ncbi:MULTISPECIES: hypothetical protein [Stenotrophomonas]|uniref:hypothetical protein n=1 Tax=Stenotrophomonas maltophilia TaxID=40324 RepID=UPI00115F88A9|nr:MULTISPECIES: hypothetical protein [Stenotrophomonas]
MSRRFDPQRALSSQVPPIRVESWFLSELKRVADFRGLTVSQYVRQVLRESVLAEQIEEEKQKL